LFNYKTDMLSIMIPNMIIL